MPSTNDRQRMMKELAKYEHLVDSLRTVLGLLDGADQRKVQSNGHSILTQAIALDATRRKVGRPKGPQKKPKRQTHQMVQKRRRKTMMMLKSLSRTEARQPRNGSTSVAVLVRHGYIKAEGDGYVLTGKPFTV